MFRLEALRFYPNCVKAIFLRGDFLRQDHNWHEALSYYDRGLGFAPESFDGLFGRGLALVGQSLSPIPPISVQDLCGGHGPNRFDEAARSFETAAKLQSGNLEAIRFATYSTILEVISQAPEQQELDYLSIFPYIPKDRADTAKLKLGQPPPEDCAILLLYDATFWGTLDYGFYITERHILVRSETDPQPRLWRLRDIDFVSLHMQKKGVYLNNSLSNSATLVPMPDSILWDGRKRRAILCRMLERLAELHRRLTGEESQQSLPPPSNASISTDEQSDTLEVECPMNGKLVELPKSEEGDEYECPYCGADIVVEDGEAAHDEVLEVECPKSGDMIQLPNADDGDEYKCPDCKATITVEDGEASHPPTLEVRCPKSGDWVELHAAVNGDEYECPYCKAMITVENQKPEHPIGAKAKKSSVNVSQAPVGISRRRLKNGKPAVHG